MIKNKCSTSTNIRGKRKQVRDLKVVMKGNGAARRRGRKMVVEVSDSEKCLKQKMRDINIYEKCSK